MAEQTKHLHIHLYLTTTLRIVIAILEFCGTTISLRLISFYAISSFGHFMARRHNKITFRDNRELLQSQDQL